MSIMLYMQFHFFFSTASLLITRYAEDKSVKGGGVSTTIRGQSGKIEISYDAQGDSSKMTFQVDAIKEVDSQGEEVGKTGAKKHSLNTLASQKFNFSSINGVAYFQGIKVINVNLTAFLSGP